MEKSEFLKAQLMLLLELLFLSEVMIWKKMVPNHRFTSDKVSATLLLFLCGAKFLITEHLDSLKHFFVGQ